MDCLLLFLILEVKVRDCYRSPVNLIRGLVEGQDFVRPVQGLGVPGNVSRNISVTSRPTVYTL